MEKQGVISFGEAFVDFLSIDSGNAEFTSMLGGATVNVAVGISRLGIPAYYLCKLGTDKTSQFVEQEFKKEGIHMGFSVHSAAKRICSVYVHTNDEGERYFHSYINRTPNEVLTADELKNEVFEQAQIFYFGSGTLFHEKAKRTTETAIEYANAANNLIAFDANLRLKRWDSEKHCRSTVSQFIKSADIVKLAEDELEFLTQTNSLEAGLAKISDWNIPYLFVTLGKIGALAVWDDEKVFVRAPKVRAIDTTGAGDAFMAALLYCYHERGKPTELTQLTSYLKLSNQAGAAATTAMGSLTALINPEEYKKHFKSMFK